MVGSPEGKTTKSKKKRTVKKGTAGRKSGAKPGLEPMRSSDALLPPDNED